MWKRENEVEGDLGILGIMERVERNFGKRRVVGREGMWKEKGWLWH